MPTLPPDEPSHPCKIVSVINGCHYLIRAIPFQDPQQEVERLKAVHMARVKIVPRARARRQLLTGVG